MNLLKQLKICVCIFTLTLVSNVANAQITYDISHEQAFKVLLAAKEKAEKSKIE